jgi:hypothetical protein
MIERRPDTAAKPRTTHKGVMYRTPTRVQPGERLSYVRARASLAMSSSQGPGKRPRWVPPIM